MESVPGRLGGAWVFRDTRMPASAVFANLEAGASIDEIIEQFDTTREQINAILEFVARSLDALDPKETCDPQFVALIERSEMRDCRLPVASPIPDFTSFTPGYLLFWALALLPPWVLALLRPRLLPARAATSAVPLHLGNLVHP